MGEEHKLNTSAVIPAGVSEVTAAMLDRRWPPTAVSGTAAEEAKASDKESEGFWGGCDEDGDNVKVVVVKVDALVVANRSRIYSKSHKACKLVLKSTQNISNWLELRSLIEQNLI